MKPEMRAEALVDLLQLFEKAGIEMWLDGGWAVDALLGMQTRPHKDVDIILRVADLPRLRDILGDRGFEIRQGGTESNFVLADLSGLEIDVHAIVFDLDGNGVYRMENGSDWIFPAAGFTGRGVVGEIGVRCLSPETQAPRSRVCSDREGLPRYGTAPGPLRCRSAAASVSQFN